jgi:hypothetical protein
MAEVGGAQSEPIERPQRAHLRTNCAASLEKETGAFSGIYESRAAALMKTVAELRPPSVLTAR